MKLEFDKNALEDLCYWVKTDRKQALRILRLILDILQHPFQGIGKLEALKHDLSGCWSRRIDKEHRLTYKVEDDSIVILSCRFHYRSSLRPR